jgi:hypothetical protein
LALLLSIMRQPAYRQGCGFYLDNRKQLLVTGRLRFPPSLLRLGAVKCCRSAEACNHNQR